MNCDSCSCILHSCTLKLSEIWPEWPGFESQFENSIARSQLPDNHIWHKARCATYTVVWGKKNTAHSKRQHFINFSANNSCSWKLIKFQSQQHDRFQHLKLAKLAWLFLVCLPDVLTQCISQDWIFRAKSYVLHFRPSEHILLKNTPCY